MGQTARRNRLAFHVTNDFLNDFNGFRELGVARAQVEVALGAHLMRPDFVFENLAFLAESSEERPGHVECGGRHDTGLYILFGSHTDWFDHWPLIA